MRMQALHLRAPVRLRSRRLRLPVRAGLRLRRAVRLLERRQVRPELRLRGMRREPLGRTAAAILGLVELAWIAAALFAADSV